MAGRRHTLGSIILAVVIVVLGFVAYWRIAPINFVEKATIVQVVILVIGLESIFLLAVQTRATNVWNKLRSYHDYFQEMPPQARVAEVIAIADAFGFSDNLRSIAAIDDAAVKAIQQHPDKAFAIRCYLDDFEEFCAAVNAGVVDSDYAYNLEGTRVIRAATVFEPLVRTWRHENKFTRCYLELDKLSADWTKRRLDEKNAENNNKGVQAKT